METTYKLSSGFKTFYWILAVLCCLMVFLIPAGILLIYLIYTAEVRMTPDLFERRYLGRKSAPWNEITEITSLPALGFLQRAMRPLRIVAKNPAKTTKIGLPVGAFERNEQLLAELQKRSGVTLNKK